MSEDLVRMLARFSLIYQTDYVPERAYWFAYKLAHKAFENHPELREP